MASARREKETIFHKTIFYIPRILIRIKVSKVAAIDFNLFNIISIQTASGVATKRFKHYGVPVTFSGGGLWGLLIVSIPFSLRWPKSIKSIIDNMVFCCFYRLVQLWEEW